jgi:pyruvate,water dikinase
MAEKKFVLPFGSISSRDAERVGRKNAALGEMIRALKKKDVGVPAGFATTADAIGSNDLTQFVLGLDRDSAELAKLFDERNEAVKSVVRDVIRTAHKAECKVGICGEAPSDYPEFTAFLVECGIDSVSIDPDRFLETKKLVARVESGNKWRSGKK